jgi:hypothetical protein
MMKKNLLVVFVTTLLFTIVFSGCIENSNSKDQIWTASEAFQDMDITFGKNSKNHYKSLDEGDTLTIQDTIDEIAYYSFPANWNETSYTGVSFDISDEVDFPLSEMVSLPFYFNADITDRFKVNDTVQITFHIKRFQFTYYNVFAKENYTQDMHISQEGFNETYYKRTQRVLMPESCIKLV